jgi:hypothetical protein
MMTLNGLAKTISISTFGKSGAKGYPLRGYLCPYSSNRG